MQVFKQYDKDGNGKLQYSEINNFMKDLLLTVDTNKKSSKQKGMTEKEMLQYSKEVADLIDRLIAILVKQGTETNGFRIGFTLHSCQYVSS